MLSILFKSNFMEIESVINNRVSYLLKNSYFSIIFWCFMINSGNEKWTLSIQVIQYALWYFTMQHDVVVIVILSLLYFFCKSNTLWIQVFSKIIKITIHKEDVSDIGNYSYRYNRIIKFNPIPFDVCMYWCKNMYVHMYWVNMWCAITDLGCEPYL